MLILQALFLWLIVSALMIGGAMLFHRRFPEESPWFGFIVPPLALVLLLNFIEHESRQRRSSVATDQR